VPHASYDHFSILTERNIFLRDRTRRKVLVVPTWQRGKGTYLTEKEFVLSCMQYARAHPACELVAQVARGLDLEREQREPRADREQAGPRQHEHRDAREHHYAAHERDARTPGLSPNPARDSHHRSCFGRALRALNRSSNATMARSRPDGSSGAGGVTNQSAR
jgi:hypothetical protein